jgi:hypothetical protein
MPLDASVLSANIHSLLTTVPIGQSPESTISTAPNTDGTSSTTVNSVLKPTYMVDPMAQVIADAVAKAVVTHFQSMAMVTGICPPGTAGGPLAAGMVK